MKKTLPLIAGLAVAVACFLAGMRAAGWRVPWSRGPHPRIQVESMVDLGVIDTGQTAKATFTVMNRGGSELILSEAILECGCSGVFWISETGARAAFSRAHVSAGKQIKVELHFLVRGQTGRATYQGLRFSTNDPEHAEMRIVCRVVPGGAASATPAILALGPIRPGQVSRHAVELRDDRRLGGFNVTRLVSSDPRSVSVAFVGAADEVGGKDENDVLGKFVGRVEVTVTAPADRSVLSERVLVYLAGEQEPVLTIPVDGRVQPRFQLLPDEVYLPRASAQGACFTARVLCRSDSGARITVRLRAVPADLSVRVDEQGDPSMRVVVIEVPPGARKVKELVRREVILIAQTGEETQDLTLRVVLSPSN